LSRKVVTKTMITQGGVNIRELIRKRNQETGDNKKRGGAKGTVKIL